MHTMRLSNLRFKKTKMYMLCSDVSIFIYFFFCGIAHFSFLMNPSSDDSRIKSTVLAMSGSPPGLKVVPTKVRSPKFGVRSLWGKTGLFNGPLEFTHMTHMTYNIT